MENNQPQLLWQGNDIGTYDSPVPDMWYLEGPWLSNHTEAATAFEAAAKKLDVQAVYRDWDNGMEIVIQDVEGQTRAIVFSLSSENRLFVRRIYS